MQIWFFSSQSASRLSLSSLSISFCWIITNYRNVHRARIETDIDDGSDSPDNCVVPPCSGDELTEALKTDKKRFENAGTDDTVKAEMKAAFKFIDTFWDKEPLHNRRRDPTGKCTNEKRAIEDAELSRKDAQNSSQHSGAHQQSNSTSIQIREAMTLVMRDINRSCNERQREVIRTVHERMSQEFSLTRDTLKCNKCFKKVKRECRYCGRDKGALTLDKYDSLEEFDKHKRVCIECKETRPPPPPPPPLG